MSAISCLALLLLCNALNISVLICHLKNKDYFISSLVQFTLAVICLFLNCTNSSFVVLT